jgi:pilus assembly protein Flp/PilA
MERLLSFLREEDGPTAVEYAAMLALIVIVAIAAIRTFGLKASELWGGNQSELRKALENQQ